MPFAFKILENTPSESVADPEILKTIERSEEIMYHTPIRTHLNGASIRVLYGKS